MLELSHIKTFLVVVDESSFSRAARKLRTSQPSISRHIDSLEKALGVRLFVRHWRGVTLTPEGKVLVTPARHATDAAERFYRCAGTNDHEGRCA
jgi:DNA-binding transcriptional LysR family regulator